MPLQVQPLSLYRFQNSPEHIPALCTIPEKPLSFASQAECSLCATNNPVVSIDSRLYYIKKGEEKEVPLRIRHFEPGSSFLTKYGRIAGLLRVHRDDPTDGRHHAFDIDALTLIQTPQFQVKLAQTLRKIELPVDVVVAPRHSAGQIFAAKVAKHCKCPLLAHDTLRRDEMDENGRAQIESARHVLIVDDVINSGSRLDGFNCSLREDFSTQFSRITFLVGLARTESEDELEQITRSLTHNHSWTATILCVEQVVLPRLAADKCPWCREMDYLSNTSRLMARPPQWLTRRLLQLRDTNTGLTNEPLLHLPRVKRRRFGQSSKVAPAGSSTMQVLFSTAMALQRLRNDTTLSQRLSPGFPHGYVLGTKSVKNYSEGMIRAALLRLLRGPEWGNSFQTALRNLLTNACCKPNQQILVGELLLGQARRDLHCFSNQEFEQVFKGFLGKTLGQFFSSLA